VRASDRAASPLREPRRTCEHHIGRFIERCAYCFVPGSSNARVIDRGLERDGNQRADAGNSHQPPVNLADNPKHLAVQLFERARKRSSRLQKNRFKPGPDQPGVQPLRQRTRFEPMRATGKPSPLKNPTSASGSLATLVSFTILPLASTNAHARQFQRHVNSGMLFHTCPSFAMSGRINRTPFPIRSGDSYLTGRSEQGPWHLIQITAADLFNDRVLPIFDSHEVKLLRLTDRASECCGNRERHEYELYLAIEDIDHSRTKTKSPQTNGICERFHKTVLNEFYPVAFRKKVYRPIEELQADLDLWIREYNEQRLHQGRWCFGKTRCRGSLTRCRWRKDDRSLQHRTKTRPPNQAPPVRSRFD
jgi:hypothetical protein